MFSPTQAKPKRLQDLPDDVLELIFERLKLPDLLSVIELNGAFLLPAQWACQHNFAYKLLKYNKIESCFHKDIDDFNGVIQINTQDALLKVLNSFETSITNLHIKYVKGSATSEMNGLLLEKCANRLRHLSIHFENNPPSLSMMFFPNVKSVIISGGGIWVEKNMWHASNLTFNLNERFPKMRRLELLDVYTTSIDILDNHFSQLDQLEIDFKRSGALNETEIVRLFRKNPQIKCIKIKSFLVGFLEVLEANFSNLESLDLDWGYPIHVRVYRFENMKKFTLKAYSFNREFGFDIIPFEFGNQLEELKVIWNCQHLGNRWVTFIKNNTNIQKLSIHFPQGTCEHYPYLTDVDIPMLKEFELEGINLKGAQILFDNMYKWLNLTKVKILNVPREDVRRFRPEISPEWTMIKYDAQLDNYFDIVMVKQVN